MIVPWIHHVCNPLQNFEIPLKKLPSFYRDKESEEETGSVRNPASICGSPDKTKSAESKEPSVDDDSVDGAAVAPRVKLAADGSIILDEERYSYFVLNYGTVNQIHVILLLVLINN